MKKTTKDMFKDRLITLRKERNILQITLAQQLGIARSAVTHYESGHVTPKIEHLVAIADYFDVSTDYLLGRCDDKWPSNLPDIFDRE
jgi:transcriptional regulator with XRE-family HTH domain